MSALFIVTTNGQTASKWLARSLNLHPEICCSHGTLRLPTCFTYSREYTAEEIKSAFMDEKRRALSLEKIFDELIGYSPQSKVFGNVHMFNLRHLHENLNGISSDYLKEIVVMDLVRHPISLIRSSAANMLDQSNNNSERKKYLVDVMKLNKDLYAEFSEKFDLDLTNYAVLAFMAGVMTLYSLDINLKLEIPRGERVQMERLTTNPEDYKAFVKRIAQNVVGVSNEYIKEVFTQQRTNIHVVGERSDTPEDIFNGWEKWQQALFLRVISRTSVLSQYQNMGYSFPDACNEAGP